MTNFEAIKNMDKESLELFLDQVYVTGINTGTYAQSLSEEDSTKVLDGLPFDGEWLDSEAEPAVINITDEDTPLLRALCSIVLKAAGVDVGDEDEIIDTAKIK